MNDQFPDPASYKNTNREILHKRESNYKIIALGKPEDLDDEKISKTKMLVSDEVATTSSSISHKSEGCKDTVKRCLFTQKARAIEQRFAKGNNFDLKARGYTATAKNVQTNATRSV